MRGASGGTARSSPGRRPWVGRACGRGSGASSTPPEIAKQNDRLPRRLPHNTQVYLSVHVRYAAKTGVHAQRNVKGCVKWCAKRLRTSCTSHSLPPQMCSTFTASVRLQHDRHPPCEIRHTYRVYSNGEKSLNIQKPLKSTVTIVQEAVRNNQKQDALPHMN